MYFSAEVQLVQTHLVYDQVGPSNKRMIVTHTTQAHTHQTHAHPTHISQITETHTHTHRNDNIKRHTFLWSKMKANQRVCSLL